MVSAQNLTYTTFDDDAVSLCFSTCVYITGRFTNASIIRPHGIAMPKGLYFTAGVPGIYPHGWERLRTGAKTSLGTDFKLWPNTSMQRNMKSTIGKKLVNLQGLPYMPHKFGELRSRNGWEPLPSFCPPPKFSHWETLPALLHGRYITDSRQTLARVM